LPSLTATRWQEPLHFTSYLAVTVISLVGVDADEAGFDAVAERATAVAVRSDT
jgi:hypothetical protein